MYTVLYILFCQSSNPALKGWDDDVEAEGEDDKADQRRGERREEAEPEPMVDPVVGEGAAFGCERIKPRCRIKSCFIISPVRRAIEHCDGDRS